MKAKELSLNSEQLQAFEDLKHALTVAPVLATPIFACLAQKQSDGNEKPISYASTKLTDTQRKWSVIEREGYAVIFGLRRFETYLIGAPIIIVTDHNPLKYIVECSPKSARLTRWALSLQKFLILHVRHKKGTDNSNADALSRLMTALTRWTDDRRRTMQRHYLGCITVFPRNVLRRRPAEWKERRRALELKKRIKTL